MIIRILRYYGKNSNNENFQVSLTLCEVPVCDSLLSGDVFNQSSIE